MKEINAQLFVSWGNDVIDYMSCVKPSPEARCPTWTNCIPDTQSMDTRRPLWL